MNFLTLSLSILLVCGLLSFFLKFKLKFIVFFTVTFSVLLGSFYYINYLDLESLESERRLELQADMQTLASKLELTVNHEVGLIRGLAAYVTQNPDLTQEEWTRFCQELMKDGTAIINMGAAPNLVLSYVYPYEANKKAVGLDFTKNKFQKAAAYIARDARNVVVAGPVNLVQGGEAFIGRMGVYLPDTVSNHPDSTVFWGLVSAPVDTKLFFLKSRIIEFVEKYDIIIKGKDARGEAGDLFFGDIDPFESNINKAFNIEIALPFGSWHLQAKHNTLTPSTSNLWLILFGVFCMGPFFFFAYQNKAENALELKNSELRLAKEQAEKAAVAKASFLANMSHEIRTPMNGILGSADLLQDITTDSDKLEYIHLIQNSCGSLITIINDILDISKIESGKLELELIPTHYESLIQEVVQLINNQPQMLKNTIEIHYSQEIPKTFLMDQVRVRQVLSNLISNANKFTDQGKITIEVRGSGPPESMTIKTSVKDTGIGMTPQQLARVFERFSQADGSTTRLFGGTGLGTTISKQLVEIMGGLLRAESIEGRGSIFTYQLPLKAIDFEVMQAKSHQATQFEGHVLLVEDNVINVKVATKTLAKFGITSDVAANGQIGVDMALSGDYDLVFMDIQMPVMDGEIATETLLEKGYKRPIVALSANAMQDDVKHYRSIGMSAVLSKPIERRDLIAVLSQFLKSS